MQISDLNRGGTIQFADDRALVASGQLLMDYSNNSVTNSSDIFPDIYGARDGVRLVVNDQLYQPLNLAQLQVLTPSMSQFASRLTLHL